ncbi:MAG: helix-turn-helix domain-containing protein [Gallionella sp.]|nr:helix-turn-helix domain-containing protein [Gallionella sp.]
MNYPIKTLSQLPLLLKGFRKKRGVTQAIMAEKLGITQQSYAYFEANPATATLDRLFMVLRLLGVEITLEQATSATSNHDRELLNRIPTVKAQAQEKSKAAGAVATKKAKTAADIKPDRIISSAQNKEHW